MNALHSFRGSRPAVIGTALLLMAAIAYVDFHVHGGVPLGLLYLLPMGLMSTVLNRWEVLVAAALCTLVAEYADAFAWTVGAGVPRDALSLIAYAAEGLYISEALANRRAERLHVRALTDEVAARREAEEQLGLLVGSSSLAILTMDDAGEILQANSAAEKLFDTRGETAAEIRGVNVRTLLPALARIPKAGHGKRALRTMMQCQGFRVTGEPFLADVWFSTYSTTRGARTAAMAVDISEEFRDREEATLQSILDGSRMAVGAMAHEMRNVCGAMELLEESLGAVYPEVQTSHDFQALRQLTATLERMTSIEVSQVKRVAAQVQLRRCFDELRVVAMPALLEQKIDVLWNLEEDVPAVWADQQGLMQVFLNLLRNARTALEGVPSPAVRIVTTCGPSTVQIRIFDNGPGVRDTSELFHLFAPQASQSGFGLYISKAIMNSFRGDLTYEPQERGACFVLELLVAA